MARLGEKALADARRDVARALENAPLAAKLAWDAVVSDHERARLAEEQLAKDAKQAWAVVRNG